MVDCSYLLSYIYLELLGRQSRVLLAVHMCTMYSVLLLICQVDFQLVALNHYVNMLCSVLALVVVGAHIIM